MKYVVLLGDGMADRPIDKLNGKTPLEAANKPMIDYICSKGEVGEVKTVPDGIAPGSDVANLSVLGYNPLLNYTGRSPLEAVSIGVELADSDITYRVNTVTLSDDENFEDKTMVDYSADEITSAEGEELMRAVNAAFATDKMHFYAGTSYRNLMVMHDGKKDASLTPPHDISKRKIKDYLPKGETGKVLCEIMKKSYEILKDHPVNISRANRGLHKANCIWFWGMGTKPMLESFEEKYKKKGALVSAVDLLKGIAISAKMKSIDVKNVTGNIHTNFAGKALAAADALTDGGYDFVYLHYEAPDECGHRAEIENKVISIERLDGALSILTDRLRRAGEEYSVMVLPDHPTPIETMTHSSDPVPYIIYRSDRECESGIDCYSEKNAKKTGIYISEGHTLIKRFLENR